LVRRGKRILLRNEAQLNCVSLRSRFDCVVRRGLSRVEMNAQKTGALDSPLRTEGRVFSFFAGQRRRCYRGDVTSVSTPERAGVALYCVLMDRQCSIYRYTTHFVEDNKEGSTALELHQTTNEGSTKRVARVVVWDAYPDFFFETFGAQIPAVVAEQLLATRTPTR